MAETSIPSSRHTGAVSVGPHAPKNHLSWFERFARGASMLAGKSAAFFSALAIVIVWLATGPIFGFSDTWQLIINTSTTIVTFLMVFLLQHSQNRDTLALQVKLADLIIAVKGADNKLATAEDLSEQELAELHASYARRAQQTLERLEAKRKDEDRAPALDRRPRPRAS
jgi:low affinity Fe/Cu permease